VNDPFQLVGTTVAEKYRIDRVLNEGGFGVVYQGYHLIVGEKVAIKCMKVIGASPGDAQRTSESFLREARALFNLTHPAIVRMYDVGALAMPLGPLPYVVLEYVEGLSLEQDLEQRVLRRAPYTPSDLLRVFEPAMEALAFAHERGVVHRDLKPSNVMLLRAGEPTMTSKVLDFGMARSGSSAVTKGAPGFTPGYAAPEQWDPSLGSAGPPCDTFALGLMVAEACTLQQVLRGEGIAQIYKATMAGAPPLALAALRPDLPTELEGVLARAIRTRPEERYANAHELLEALRVAFGQTIARPPAPAPPRRQSGAIAPPGHQGGVLAPSLLSSAPPGPPATAEPKNAPRGARTPPVTPSVAPLLVGVLALVLTMGALAVVGALLLGQRRPRAVHPLPPALTTEPSAPAR
jgi:serine/threonine-protein kinase